MLKPKYMTYKKSPKIGDFFYVYAKIIDMDWTFSIGWFITGLFIFIAGAFMVIKYQWVAYNIANGVSSFDKVKLFGVIAIVVGLLIMANLHTFFLGLLVNLFFNH